MQSCLDIIPDNTARVLVAYSGGLDSSVLLHLAIQRAANFEVVPWHINHGLVDVADVMEQFCLERAREYGLQPIVDRLDLGDVGGNIEAEARTRRYRLMARRSRAGDCIVTAHHADDQAETFLLNALRGSASAGLRGIAPSRPLGDALLLRPLLPFDRARLETYAAEHEISWFNDPSNRHYRFDRNYLRHEVIPAIRARWPKFQHGLATASALQGETQALLDEIAAEDFGRLRREASAGLATLDATALLAMGDGRRHNLVRHWIAEAGLNPLPQARLLELDRQLHARCDATPEIAMPDYSIRIYDRRLFLVPRRTEPRCRDEYDFERNPVIEIESIEFYATRSEILRRLGVDDRDQSLSLRFRDEARQNPDRHRLKRLFQKHRVPPWRRARVAQVYLDGELAGILP